MIVCDFQIFTITFLKIAPFQTPQRFGRLSNGWKGGDFFILLCLSFALYPILTLGNAVLSAMQESNLMELFPVARPQDLALRHFIAASVPAVLAHGTSVLIGALCLQPYWPELPRTPSYFSLFRAVLYASQAASSVEYSASEFKRSLQSGIRSETVTYVFLLI